MNRRLLDLLASGGIGFDRNYSYDSDDYGYGYGDYYDYGDYDFDDCYGYFEKEFESSDDSSENGENDQANDSLEEAFANILKVPRNVDDLGEVLESPTGVSPPASGDSPPVSEVSPPASGEIPTAEEVLKEPVGDDPVPGGETVTTELSTKEEEEKCEGAKKKTFTGTSIDMNQKENGDHKEKLQLSGIASSVNEKETLPVQLSKGLQEMATMLRHHAEQNEIYAVQPYDGGSRSARITLKGDKLCLHRLRKKHPPPGSFTVYHSDVMKLVDPKSRLTFLELCEDFCANFGIVYIRLAGDTKAAMQFSYLCTGEKGPSYAGDGAVALFNSKDEKLEYVRMGDYEHGDGTGGKALVSGLMDDNKENYIRPWVAGTLEGGWIWSDVMSTQFDIMMKDNPGRLCEAAFGIVEEGFERLQQGVAITRGLTESLIILDCGIVLPS